MLASEEHNTYMTTSKHFSEYKKYQTSMSFGGCHFAVKGDTAAATCPCGWVHEFPANPGIDNTIIELCKAHMEAHEAAAKQVALEVGE